MKKLIISLLFLFCSVFSAFAQENVSTYHYNKVYDYRTDTIVPKKYHADSMLIFADKLIGIPYVSPGRDLSGFDCSGFTFYCFKPYDVILPYTAHEQAEIGKEVTLLEAKPGDLVFFRGADINDHTVHHVAIVVSNATSKKGGRLKMIQSASHGVHYDYLDNPYYHPRFIKIMRVR